MGGGDELLRAAHTDPAGAVTTVQCERSMNNISADRDYSRRLGGDDDVKL